MRPQNTLRTDLHLKLSSTCLFSAEKEPSELWSQRTGMFGFCSEKNLVCGFSVQLSLFSGEIKSFGFSMLRETKRLLIDKTFHTP